jgi:hypothetical protein
MTSGPHILLHLQLGKGDISATAKTPDFTVISVNIGGSHRAVAVGFELENRLFATCGEVKISCYSNGFASQ